MKKIFIKWSSVLIGICALSFSLFSCGKGENTTTPDPSIHLSYTLINDGAAYEVSGIGTCLDTEIVIPEKINNIPVVSIGESAFEFCYYLTGIIFPDTLHVIGENAFLNCYGLISLTLPENLSSIETNAFLGCYKLIEIKNLSSLILTPNSEENGYVSAYAKNIYTAKTGTSYLTLKNDYVLYRNGAEDLLMGYNGSETDIIAPAGITEIYNYAFFKEEIKSFTIENGISSLTVIGDYAFWHCEKMTTADFSSAVQTVGNYAFYGCTLLEDISFPETLLSVGNYAFYACNSISTIAFGNNLQSIGCGAFEQCANLKSATFALTSCWSISSSEDGKNGTNISIPSAETGADYLTETYVNKYWSYSPSSSEETQE